MKNLGPNQALISALSHDLRNPLGAILAYADLLAQNTEVTGRARKHVESIRRSATRIDAIIQKLVDVAEIQAGQFSIERRSHSLTAAILEAIEQASIHASARNIEICVSGADELPEFYIDRSRIAQTVEILLNNAIQFSSSGKQVHLRVSLFAGNRIEIAVTDFGPGLEDTKINAILEGRAPNSNRPARGLSLLLAKTIIEAHGGRLEIKSKIDSGATFSFSLPIYQSSPQEEEGSAFR